MKTALVCGGHGFIGHHMALRLKKEGYWVRTIDIAEYEYGKLNIDEYIIGDLRDMNVCLKYTLVNGQPFDEVYQFAYRMGGAGIVFSGGYDAEIMHDSALIDINIAEACRINRAKKIFSASSACTYPSYNQTDPLNPKCSEKSAYPADPDSDYGFTKLFGERLYQAYHRNHKLNIRIARFHNIFGECGSWNNGKEKAPSALCRKIAMAKDGNIIEIWGPGSQTRSFLYIDECLEGIRRLMNSDFIGPVNIGSEEMISINDLARMIMDIADKKLTIKNVPGPMGVMGRNSDNHLIQEKLGWAPSKPLREGMEKLYKWIDEQVKLKRKKNENSSHS
jgi:nucleoside-diphosphate-sugar epimerase